MRTVAAPIDTRVRDAYVKILLRIEEENGEKIINYARIALTALYFALGVLLGKEECVSNLLRTDSLHDSLRATHSESKDLRKRL